MKTTKIRRFSAKNYVKMAYSVFGQVDRIFGRIISAESGRIFGRIFGIRSYTTNHWFFGQFTRDLSKICLPLKIDVIRLYLFKRHETGKSRLVEKDKNEIYNHISERLFQIWTEASLSVKSEKAINSQVKRELKKIFEVVERETPSSVSDQWKAKTFQTYKLNQMFDICGCTCFANVSSKDEIKLENCKCDDVKLKIPTEELDFYIDQKFERRMQTSSYRDLKTQQKYEKQQAKFVKKISRTS